MNCILCFLSSEICFQLTTALLDYDPPRISWCWASSYHLITAMYGFSTWHLICCFTHYSPCIVVLVEVSHRKPCFALLPPCNAIPSIFVLFWDVARRCDRKIRVFYCQAHSHNSREPMFLLLNFLSEIKFKLCQYPHLTVLHLFQTFLSLYVPLACWYLYIFMFRILFCDVPLPLELELFHSSLMWVQYPALFYIYLWLQRNDVDAFTFLALFSMFGNTKYRFEVPCTFLTRKLACIIFAM